MLSRNQLGVTPGSYKEGREKSNPPRNSQAFTFAWKLLRSFISLGGITARQ